MMNKKYLLRTALVFTLIGSSVVSSWAQPRRRVIKLRQDRRQKRAAARRDKRAVPQQRLPFALKEGITFMEAERFGLAAARFSVVVKKHPRMLRPRILLATSLIRLNRNREAYQVLKKALELYPYNTETHFLMGALLFKNRRFQMARVHLKKSLNLPVKLKPHQKEKTLNMLKFIEDNKPQAETGELSDEASPSLSPEERELSDISVEVSIYSDMENKFRIAVIDFNNKNEAAKAYNYGEVFSEMLTTALIKNQGFDVVERGQIKKVLEEKSLQMSGIVEGTNAQELGNLLGVDFIIIGGISTLGQQIEIDLRLVQVDNGEAVLAESATAHGEGELRKAATTIIVKIDNIYQQEGTTDVVKEKQKQGEK